MRRLAGFLQPKHCWRHWDRLATVPLVLRVCWLRSGVLSPLLAWTTLFASYGRTLVADNMAALAPGHAVPGLMPMLHGAADSQPGPAAGHVRAVHMAAHVRAGNMIAGRSAVLAAGLAGRGRY